MTAPTTTARLAVPSDREEVAALCLEAFADEAVITWLLPDPATRPAQMRTMFVAPLENAIAAETVLRSEERRVGKEGRSRDGPRRWRDATGRMDLTSCTECR